MMSLEHPSVAGLIERFPDIDFAPAPLIVHGDRPSDQICVRVPPQRLVEVMQYLRDDASMRYEQLCDLAGIDYLHYPDARDRFAVVYSLLSLTYNRRLWVKCFCNEPDLEVPSVTGLYKAAEWLEREVYDMFGIRFAGHPDLRRILTWEGFEAHPLRKDYPLRGLGERERFEVVRRDSA